MAAVAAEVGQKAHARMLEERQTPASGDSLPLADALHLLQSGQLVNLAAGPNAAPGRILTSGVPSPSAAQIAAELGRSLGVPTELVLDGLQGEETEITAAEVLTIDHAAGEIFLGFDEAPHGVIVDYPAVIDFTDATGTDDLAGSVTVVHDGSGGFRPRANVRVRHASPAYQVHVHLVTPGPDVFAESRDHTLRAAFGKAMTQLHEQITSRAGKRWQRFKSNLKTRRGA